MSSLRLTRELLLSQNKASIGLQTPDEESKPEVEEAAAQLDTSEDAPPSTADVQGAVSRLVDLLYFSQVQLATFHWQHFL